MSIRWNVVSEKQEIEKSYSQKKEKQARIFCFSLKYLKMNTTIIVAPVVLTKN